MAQQANIREVNAVSELRGRVVETSETLARLVDDCNSTMQRVVDWVSRDRASYWKYELRRRDQKIQSARSDLERAKIARPDADPRSFTDQTRALKKAKLRLDEAQAKQKPADVGPLNSSVSRCCCEQAFAPWRPWPTPNFQRLFAG
jgi:hypothetical protein